MFPGLYARPRWHIPSGIGPKAAYHRTDLFERRRELMTAWAAFATAVPGAVVPIGLITTGV